MPKKKINKKIKVGKAVKEEVLKVEIRQPEFEIAPDTYKKEPIESEPMEIPKEIEPEPAINPNNPKTEGITEGHKTRSLIDLKPVYTKEQYKELIKDYAKRNPAKYEAKKSELERKMKLYK